MKKAILTILIFVFSATSTFAVSADTVLKQNAERLNRKPINIEKYHVIENTWNCNKFIFKHPELFYVHWNAKLYRAYPKKIDKQKLKARAYPLKTIQLKYTMSDAQIKKARVSFNKKVNQIVAKARRKSTDREKIRVVNDEIKKACTYTLKAKNRDNAYGALIEGKAVCEGYAKAFKVCMDRLGIPCDYATGVRNGGPHVWNTVKIKERAYRYVKKPYKAKYRGRYVTRYKKVRQAYYKTSKYHVDVTWNDTARTNRYLFMKSH